VITLKEALLLNDEEILSLRKEITTKIEEQKTLGAYIEQLTSNPITSATAGIPIAIKDNINVLGSSLTCCSNILKGYTAPYNATVIENLEKSGLSAFGRTNMDEFAMGSSTE